MKLCRGPKKINLQTDDGNEFGGRLGAESGVNK